MTAPSVPSSVSALFIAWQRELKAAQEAAAAMKTIREQLKEHGYAIDFTNRQYQLRRTRPEDADA